LGIGLRKAGFGGAALCLQGVHLALGDDQSRLGVPQSGLILM